MHYLLVDNLPELKSLFKKYRVNKAYAFGSICTPQFNESSDIDFLISFEHDLDPLVQGENWWALYYDLKKLMRREIDLVNEQTIQNPFLIKVVNKTKTSIYER
jgi:uncharacterized protein